MWPYNDDEAGWLTPPPASANDNDPERRVAPRMAPTLAEPTRKEEPET
jgi:hypothetical protein